jgi:hypothetical protein
VRLGPEDRPRIEAAFRLAAFALGVRIVLPRLGDRLPDRGDVGGAPPDPGPPAEGWFRPAHRRQDPAADPREPSGETSSAGEAHGWANCTMTAGAVVLAFDVLGDGDAGALWGGDLRHAPSQPDYEGGTDLYDLAAAWADYGRALQVRTGAGWAGVLADLEEGRALVLTGTGNVPGQATYDGGHAIAVLPEPGAPGRRLIGDPLAVGFEWVDEDELRRLAERLEPGVNYARSAAHPPAPASEDVMYNVGPMTTHRDAIVRDGGILYRDAGLTVRQSVATGDTALGFLGSVGDTAHVVVNAGYSNYVNRCDVLRIVPNDREYE